MGYLYPCGLDLIHPYPCRLDQGQPLSNPKCILGGLDMDLRIGSASLDRTDRQTVIIILRLNN
ncbi:uncharacterized protein P174DRAFT_444309 [Aspergillus novofumigatus IBT 16806]|uniref:Uncharacterized protein n=1 Tax=Aspergillus novofumigatus (strain IBT 16806) TaxID=1392255 RepID=A0A2I1BYS1_ASPN1|nr:uncharacterized protein P174DRAFT_444309 [Aspergillus novofumigatus IBT 16806]PKX90523.1 hypothetical protein P174DRAFT_444309 [Aspergillus novofumigatus IBT 16806]